MHTEPPPSKKKPLSAGGDKDKGAASHADLHAAALMGATMVAEGPV